MDPNITLNDMLEAIRNLDAENALVHLAELYDWHKNGGFTPDLNLALICMDRDV